MKRSYIIFLLVIAGASLFFLVKGIRPPTPPEDFIFRLVSEEALPNLPTDGSSNISSLLVAVRESLVYLSSRPEEEMLDCGFDKIPVNSYRIALEELAGYLESSPGKHELNGYIQAHFLFYQYGSKAFVTGYYEPQLNCDLAPSEGFPYPLYQPLPEQVEIDLSLFSPPLTPPLSRTLVGRLTKENTVLPHFTRDQIDFEGALKGRNLELAWCDNLTDIFFLHIQGSGRIRLSDGTTRFVGYAGKNGHSYHAIGKTLMERGYIKREQANLFGIKQFLNDHPRLLREILIENPSYVFFQFRDKPAVGSIGRPLTAERSIASDLSILPRGALVLLSINEPILVSKENTAKSPYTRLVLNQDTGGAIRGAGRIDLFTGSGKDAEYFAGHLRNEGSAFLLVPKAID